MHDPAYYYCCIRPVVVQYWWWFIISKHWPCNNAFWQSTSPLVPLLVHAFLQQVGSTIQPETNCRKQISGSELPIGQPNTCQTLWGCLETTSGFFLLGNIPGHHGPNYHWLIETKETSSPHSEDSFSISHLHDPSPTGNPCPARPSFCHIIHSRWSRFTNLWVMGDSLYR